MTAEHRRPLWERPPARAVPGASVAATAAMIVVLVAVGTTVADGLADWVQHGMGHALVGVPLTALAVYAVRRWPPPRPTRPARTARTVVATAIAAAGGGQLLEMLGARVDEPTAAPAEEWFHAAGQIVTTVGMVLLLAGVVLALAAATLARSLPWWASAVAAAAAGTLFGVLVFGGH